MADRRDLIRDRRRVPTGPPSVISRLLICAAGVQTLSAQLPIGSAARHDGQPATVQRIPHHSSITVTTCTYVEVIEAVQRDITGVVSRSHEALRR